MKQSLPLKEYIISDSVGFFELIAVKHFTVQGRVCQSLQVPFYFQVQH